MKTEIAYSTSGFSRVVQDGERYEVQALRIRAASKIGRARTCWTKLYGVWDRDLALTLLEFFITYQREALCPTQHSQSGRADGEIASAATSGA